jgi:hypothetical protein
VTSFLYDPKANLTRGLKKKYLRVTRMTDVFSTGILNGETSVISSSGTLVQLQPDRNFLPALTTAASPYFAASSNLFAISVSNDVYPFVCERIGELLIAACCYRNRIYTHTHTHTHSISTYCNF